MALGAEGLDGLLVTHLPNIRYLTGFTGSAAVLLVREDTTILISDFRYASQAPLEVGAAATVEIDQRSVWERLGRVLAARPAGRSGHRVALAHRARRGAGQRPDPRARWFRLPIWSRVSGP